MLCSHSSSSSLSCHHSAERTSISSPPTSFSGFSQHFCAGWSHQSLSQTVALCLPPPRLPALPGLYSPTMFPWHFRKRVAEDLDSFRLFGQFTRPKRERWHSEKTLTKRELLWNSKQTQRRRVRCSFSLSDNLKRVNFSSAEEGSSVLAPIPFYFPKLCLLLLRNRALKMALGAFPKAFNYSNILPRSVSEYF